MVVRVLREHTGRGPTRSRAHLTDDLIVVVVWDTLTQAEHTLVASGLDDLVLRTRKALQNSMRADLVAGVQALSGREVIAIFTDSAIVPDAALIAFALAPLDESAGNDRRRAGSDADS